jgi:mRNA interferase MazF
MVDSTAYTPQRGDVVRILLNPQVWYEQSGLRPAVVISPAAYNSKVGLALFCAVSSLIKGYPFEVGIPDGLPVSGAVLADQVKILDWKSRKAEFVCSLPAATVNEIMGKVQTIIL